ncbi:hypothetical protein IW137_002251 [Coemansia sp. RSA 1287]|nr:hypothetical protein IW137_002251 [Coemansia sp. RSA 1287]
MDSSESRERNQRTRREEYETPLRQAHELDSGFGGIEYTRTPASVAGVRLDLAPPQFAIQSNISSDLAGSAFATPVNAFTTPEKTNEWRYSSGVTPKHPVHGAREMDGYWSPDDSMTGMQFNNHIMDGPPTPFGVGPNVVDQDFILNLNQEGDIQRLTRKAEGDIKLAGKQLIVDALRKQVDSLDEDKWMYSN